MINKLKKVKIRDLLGFIILILAIPVALIVKIKNRKNPIWLICELENMARDNGYHFFKYIKTEHPELNCYYAVNKNCHDYEKIKKYGHVIQFGSFKHWVYYLSAQYNISSHKEGNPNHTVFTFIHLYLHLLNNRVFLQHGITKDNAKMFYYKNTYFKYMICGAKREYDYIRENFGYPDSNLVYTGFARFDNLHHNDVDNKKILLIPTWRRKFELTNDKKEFVKSEYYQRWNSFINNEKLIRYLENNNMTLIFYPHYSMRKFIDTFNVSCKNIDIQRNDNNDIQAFFKECSLMITDYSSVYMDFAYMRKPVVYYQFDYDEYRSSHFEEGYFEYNRDGFGDIFTDEQKLVDNIIRKCDDNYRIEEKYLKRMNDFFEINDDKNCERIYKVLMRGE